MEEETGSLHPGASKSETNLNCDTPKQTTSKETNTMASKVSQSEVECTCPVCCDIFNDPVVLLCGHSFCKYCLQEWWRQSSQKTCPVCKEMFPMPQPPRNLALKNLSEALRQERSQTLVSRSNELCLLHNEKRKLFCQNDGLPICLVCKESKAHKQHSCIPINEAAEDYRAELRIKLVNLQSKLGSFGSKKLTYDKMATHIQLQAQQTEREISAEFRKLYQFLRAEEAARVDACRKEAALKSEAMDVRILNLTAEIGELKQKIQTIKKALGAEDLAFLLNLRKTMKGSEFKLPDPETPSGALMDEAKHVGNLQFSVWKKMADKIQYTPVTLDPNTGGSSLIVLENLTRSTTSIKELQFPFNPERLNFNDILGYEGFTSGKHCWDVEVGGYWAVGVANKTKTQTRSWCSHEIWAIYMCVCGNILRQLTPEDYVTEVAKDFIPQKLRIELDYDQGILTFFDLGRKKLVHTIKYTFTGTLFPYFRENAKILPAEMSVGIKTPRNRIWKTFKAK
ncbi:E3 ubiquitin-protein ligase TRIM35-like isoform X2 [Melanotaenia boesemani]|uniref:E3 ubiquitin-protein ligase TRIM35-like isoform X2 n=1 Tax=Melanotaenia boesemani TaxID=1250792 RepID=UPI001C053361|nr:E3 ubiquitin-protein ligase TRIM35-like isoform X2 [Melanotaenia boesemani]